MKNKKIAFALGFAIAFIALLVIAAVTPFSAFNTTQFNPGGNMISLAVGVPLTNGINWGTSFASPGAGANSEQFGVGATASAAGDVALGDGATATGGSGLALGRNALTGPGSVGLGSSVNMSGVNSVGLGANATGGGNNNTLLGANTGDGGHTFVTVVGTAVFATSDHQILLGSVADKTTVPGPLEMLSGFRTVVSSNVPGTSIIFDISAGAANQLLTTNGNFTQNFTGVATNGARWEFTTHNTGTTNAQWAFPSSYYSSGSDSNTVSFVTMPPQSTTTINWEYYTGFGSPTNYVIKSITTKSAQMKVPYTGFIVYCDISASTDFYVTLTNAVGSPALIAFTNAQPIGQPYSAFITVKEDGTGARLYNFTNIVDFSGGAQTATTTNLNKGDVWLIKASTITQGRYVIQPFATNMSNL